VKRLNFSLSGIFSLLLILISTLSAIDSASGHPTQQPGINSKTGISQASQETVDVQNILVTDRDLNTPVQSDSLLSLITNKSGRELILRSTFMRHITWVISLLIISLFILGFLFFQSFKMRKQFGVSEKRFRVLMEANPSAIMIFQNFKIKFVNSSFEKLTGFTREELLQMEVWQLIHPGSFNNTAPEKISLESDGFSFRGEFEIITKNKEVVWIDMSTRSIVFEEKPAILATSVDITERKITEERLSESELRYKTFFEKNSASMLIIEPATGKIVDANQSAISFYGYQKEQLLSMNIRDLNVLSPEEIAHEEELAAYENRANHILRHKLADGAERDVEIYYSVVKINSIIYNYSLIFDVTERCRIENELKRAKEQAEEANRVKSFFVSTVSHEIRTPLNAIVGLTDLIIEGETLSDEQMKYMHSIKFSSDHLLGIINDVLDFSKLEAGKVVLEKIDFDLVNLVSECVKAIELKAKEKNIRFNLEIDSTIPAVLKGDPSRLRQILLNLLSNAEKFTNEGNIDIQARLLKLDAEHVEIRFSISDTGKGIAADKQNSLFQSFTQEDPGTSRKYGGTGLGLSISKKLVDLQNGQIGLRSVEGVGSTFWFILPYEISEKTFLPDMKKIPSIQTRDLKGIKILLAEDDRMNQFVMRKTLEKWNVELDIANNGKEAVDKLMQNYYHLVLLDLHMPELTGYEVIKIIRDPFTGILNHHIPVIALTADVTTETQQKVKEAGMNGFITKPSEQGIIYDKIISTINNQKTIFVEKQPDENQQYSDNQYNIDKTKIRIRKALTDIFDDDIEGIVALIVKFLKEIPWTIVGINEAFYDHDMETLGRLIHKIKPGYSYLGFSEVSEKISKIQELAKIGNQTDNIESLCRELDEDSRNIISILREVHKDFIRENSMRFTK
jgi:PAS domain S-box-containing protein